MKLMIILIYGEGYQYTFPTMTKTNMILVVTDSYLNQTDDTLIMTYRVL